MVYVASKFKKFIQSSIFISMLSFFVYVLMDKGDGLAYY